MTHEKNMLRSAGRGTAIAGMASTLGFLGLVAAGCLSRPVINQEPTTKTSFTAQVRQAAIDKVDLLFAIDNSSSMGDKQQLLKEAVPDLVRRLLNPFCVDELDQTKVLGQSNNGVCPTGQQAEFQPVADIHIGIISSALGSRGGTQCADDNKDPTNPAVLANSNDRGRLLNRPSTAEGQGFIANFQPSSFLSWLPDVDKNKGKLENRSASLSPPLGDANALIADFQEMVSRVREYGCGYEAQLESVYRFLVQPDPYANVVVDPSNKVATLEGVDSVLLKQRAEFLRPDSLVAVIMVTDENENTVDPLSLGGRGWAFISAGWPLVAGEPRATAPKPTSVCEATPLDKSCTSCGVTPKPNDPNCAGDDVFLAPEDDRPNVRMIQMKRRFGVDPQFPIQRYVDGFRSARVPNRDGEHPVKTDGSGRRSDFYVGQANCTNPLYARDLPTEVTGDEASAINGALCTLQRGPRTPDLVFFAVIGGVPWQLLVKDPVAATPELKEKLGATDWTQILGADPLSYDTAGADPHMIESITPRQGLPATNAADNADAVHGREWTTKGDDLQYACTFELTQAKDCTDPKLSEACDCTTRVLSDGKNPPLCDASVKTRQVRGKAYPTIRELSVARALGDQGIAASICPIRVRDTADGTDPLYGYRPAVKSIVDRLRNALSSQCLPQKLNVDSQGNVPCLILETLPEEGPQSLCDDNQKYPGRKQPDPQVLARFREQQQIEAGDAGAGDVQKFPTCELQQITVPPGESCTRNAQVGWCYVTNVDGKTPAGSCPQAVLFSPGANQPGARISLQCIKSSEVVQAEAGAGD